MKTARLAWLVLPLTLVLGCSDDPDAAPGDGEPGGGAGASAGGAGKGGSAGSTAGGAGASGKGGMSGSSGQAGSAGQAGGGASGSAGSAAGTAGAGGGGAAGASGAGASGAGQAGAGAGGGGAGGGAGAAPVSEVHFLGRFDRTDPAQPLFAWPGTALVTRFEGTGIDVKLHDSGGNFFGVSIDGGAFTVLKTGKANDTYTLASGLPAGPHDVVLAKRTESFVGAVRFEAFVPQGGALIATPAPYARRIEFIGDSITCGYGNEGEGPNCPFTPDTENELLAYGALTARALDAEHHAIAYSGKGAYRDYSGSTEAPMALLYDRVVADDPKSAWDFSWTADVVVINLGTNDFAKGDPGQPYVDGIQALVTKVRQHHPDAFVVLALGPALSGGNLAKARGYLQSVVDDRTQGGDSKISLVEMDTQQASNGLGCDYHPSLETHQLMADTMTAAIKSLTGW